ncbi:uncharacterized protein A1O5_11471 [Cladophialophora psammophila CBS 110553]|uniref:Uncharacterized protein n=1 Tax=Cladophialophora psammophila CBS 110553 TaxID=1182543 RepID=W9W5Q6_9EURO|nr:uncharacterized protein A1O5_11471 [Cladophialophora psammophila CBS 110553]EXJ63422.1 hypothetical protein A1O5_11471 [Cladophialophora psammophila CBS 110553]
MVATAGQVGCDENRVFPEDLNDQIILAMENLARALEAAGASVKDVYKLVYHIIDYDPVNRIHAKHLEAFLKGGGGPLGCDRTSSMEANIFGFLESVSLGLADLLHANSVVLSSPVFRIAQSPEGVFVSAARGDFLCKRVIFSVQTILYRSITFDPPLPPAKLELAKHSVQSFSFKHIILYSEP